MAKKSYNVKPTERQKRAFDNLSENITNKGKALQEAGYKKSVSESPTLVTESKGWLQLMEKHLPDKDLARVHKEGLEATTLRGDEEVKDFQTRHKYLDTAYKLKGSYAPEKSVTVQVKASLKDFSKYDKLREKFKEEFKNLVNE